MSFEKSDSPSTPPQRLGIYPDVCVVMVTYSPDSSFDENVRALLPQVGKLIIVDNQSVPAARLLIVQAAASGDVEVIWNEQNLGIAAGSNKEIERALSSGQFSWIVTFDQDSRAPADYVAAIFAAYSACPFRVRLASSELTMMASTRYDESLFMDYVDHAFCLRLRRHGLRIIQAGNAVLPHRLGSPTWHRILWKRFRTSNHSSNRRYHNAHNRLPVYGR